MEGRASLALDDQRHQHDEEQQRRQGHEQVVHHARGLPRVTRIRIEGVKRLWLLLTLKPAGMRWRRWLRLNRVVSRALAQRRDALKVRSTHF